MLVEATKLSATSQGEEEQSRMGANADDDSDLLQSPTNKRSSLFGKVMQSVLLGHGLKKSRVVRVNTLGSSPIILQQFFQFSPVSKLGQLPLSIVLSVYRLKCTSGVVGHARNRLTCRANLLHRLFTQTRLRCSRSLTWQLRRAEHTRQFGSFCWAQKCDR